MARRFLGPSGGSEGMLPKINFKILGLDYIIFPIQPVNVLSNNRLLEEAQEECHGKNVESKFMFTKFWEY